MLVRHGFRQRVDYTNGTSIIVDSVYRSSDGRQRESGLCTAGAFAPGPPDERR